MTDLHSTSLEAFATGVREAQPAGFVDLYLERVADAVWHVEAGRVVGRHALVREGAAVRRDGILRSSDGASRVILADLLGVPGRRLPPLAPPPFPQPPDLADLAEEILHAAGIVRWRWRWAAVVNRESATALTRPQLCELTLADGLRTLATWPPAPAFALPAKIPERAYSPTRGAVRVLLSPQAAAVLIHEAVGHPLEGGESSLLAGSPLGRSPITITGAAIDIVDDPTRTDLPGAFSADDEGTAARPRVLVKEGVVIDVLADRNTASRLRVSAGNARRASVHAFPRPRLSNLVVEGSGWPTVPCRDDADIEVGGVSAGSLVPRSGEIRLVARTAWRLRAGRRVRPLAPFLLAGSTAAVLNSIAVAGPSAPSSEPGWCGKAGEVVPTGSVAPWLLVEGLEVR